MERAREQMGNGLPSFTGKFQTLLGFLAPAGFVLSAVWHPSPPNLRLGAGALLGAGLGEHRATLCIPPALPAAAKLSNVLTGCFAPSSAFKPSPPPAPFLIITGQTQPQPVAWLLFV